MNSPAVQQPKTKVSAVIFAILILVVAVMEFLGLHFNTTSSLPFGVYQEADRGIKRGSLAVFCLQNEAFINLAKERGYLGQGHCPGGIKPLGKKVFGLPGDQISMKDGLIAVNGNIVPATKVKQQDSLGRMMPGSLLAPGRIPEGYALMLSPNHPSGFDSRYFGLVQLTALMPVEPVLTWKESNNPKEEPL